MSPKPVSYTVSIRWVSALSLLFPRVGRSVDALELASNKESMHPQFRRNFLSKKYEKYTKNTLRETFGSEKIHPNLWVHASLRLQP